MNILVPYFVFVFSVFPVIQYPDHSTYDDVRETDITIGMQFFEILSIEGQVKTEMFQITPTMFSPFQDEYYVRAFLSWKGFTLGAEHVCYHPVESMGRDMYQFVGGHNRIYFEFDSRGLK